jgi:hypothetical protein
MCISVLFEVRCWKNYNRWVHLEVHTKNITMTMLFSLISSLIDFNLYGEKRCYLSNESAKVTIFGSADKYQKYLLRGYPARLYGIYVVRSGKKIIRRTTSITGM